MAANKKDGGTPQAAAKKTAHRGVEKKRKPNRSRSGTSDFESIAPLPPEVLADLAVKLVRLNTAASTVHSRPEPRLAAPGFDAIFADALKRAEMLFLEASGKSDEDIHAYQLFTEKDGLMSFEEIAERFKEVGWGKATSRNTVEPVIEELVIAAELEIQKERERCEKLVSVRTRYPGGVYHLADRARRHIGNMINRTGLRDLFDDPKQVADMMGQYFFRLMEKKVSGDWERHLDEEYVNEAGVDSFINYVCGGLSYEQFIRDPPQVWMDLERLGSFIFFLESLGTEKHGCPQFAAQDFGSLMRLVYARRDVSSGTQSDLEACLTELKKQEPDTARFKELANSARLSLTSMRDLWHLTKLCLVLGFSRLLREVRGRSKERKRGYKVSAAKAQRILLLLQKGAASGKSGGESINAGQLAKLLDEARNSLDVRDLNVASRLPVAKIRKMLKLLQRADKAGMTGGESMDAGQLRRLLDDIREGMQDPDLHAAARIPARYFDGMIIDEMNRVVTDLDKGLRMKPPAKKHLKESLGKLLRDLRPHSGERKCRPFELFVFAAQKRLLQDKLIRRRSSLAPHFIPNPPNPTSSLSIIETHRGAEIAMGIKGPDDSFV